MVLATAVADNLVIASDPDAPASGIYYWEISKPWREAVVAAIRTGTDATVRTLGEALLEAPADPRRYAALHAALLARYGKDPAVNEILNLAWRAECNSRLGHHLGDRYLDAGEPVTVAELAAYNPGPGLPAGAKPEAVIVIPFRDRTPGGGDRLRNLLACLLALRDQSFPRGSYQVTVVETDDRPRWRELISRFADTYLFAPKPDTFNRSWGVNTGVVNTSGPTEIICIQDADVLADRDFVARNAARFTGPGRMGHHPYRDMLCMDHFSTWRAIRERVADRRPAGDDSRVRGFTLRRGPGCCVWVRAEAFHRVGGMDERYEGWGGEDIDFNHRFGMDLAYDCYDDVLLHMRHPASSALRSDGELINAHIPPMSWQPDGPIGQLDRFAPVETEAAYA
ncbi:MAG: hypothetical protein AUI14_09030 [Actinobacteria bacterium 13_2_20CM_2_71_6]|nr:MAG: hypothetical protein AUI14_09030 [Actinobacteria bacterium 13_2_20CM_2_71_6]